MEWTSVPDLIVPVLMPSVSKYQARSSTRPIRKHTEEWQKRHEAVIAAGGLHIVGTERHESRRVDNQLRGRSGRQGDAGSSRFYLSLEDDLLRIFGSDRISGIMGKLGMDEDEPIEHNMISKAIENAQRKVEGHNFDIRKHLLEYDDVMNKQREVIYNQRREVLASESVKTIVGDMIVDIAQNLAAEFVQTKVPSEDWDWQEMGERAQLLFGFEPKWPEEERQDLDGATLAEKFQAKVQAAYEKQEESIGSDTLRYLERIILLQMVDNHWKDHLLNMDHLKEGIGLRGYGQKNPLNEYKKEGFEMFMAMIDTVKLQTVGALFRVQLAKEEEVEEMSLEHRKKKQKMKLSRGGEGARQPAKREGEKIGRNAPCPCGSGKKYKRCCGRKT